jgi:hypothetical protein
MSTRHCSCSASVSAVIKHVEPLYLFLEQCIYASAVIKYVETYIFFSEENNDAAVRADYRALNSVHDGFLSLL